MTLNFGNQTKNPSRSPTSKYLPFCIKKSHSSPPGTQTLYGPFGIKWSFWAIDLFDVCILRKIHIQRGENYIKESLMKIKSMSTYISTEMLSFRSWQLFRSQTSPFYVKVRVQLHSACFCEV